MGTEASTVVRSKSESVYATSYISILEYNKLVNPELFRSLGKVHLIVMYDEAFHKTPSGANFLLSVSCCAYKLDIIMQHTENCCNCFAFTNEKKRITYFGQPTRLITCARTQGP